MKHKLKRLAAMLLSLCMVTSLFPTVAFAAGTEYANTTVNISELAVGSIIKENVILNDDTGAFVCLNVSDGTLRIGVNSSGVWYESESVANKGFLETLAGYGSKFDQLEVTENQYYKGSTSGGSTEPEPTPTTHVTRTTTLDLAHITAENTQGATYDSVNQVYTNAEEGWTWSTILLPH